MDGRLIGLALALMVTSTRPAVADPQRNAPGPDDIEIDAAVLRDRNRVLLHRGEPLDLRGLEEGGYRFAEQSPALASAHPRRLVDEEANYRRKLAMYAGGERLSSAAPRARSTPSNKRSDADPTLADEAEPRASQSVLRIALYCAAATAATCLLALGAHKWGARKLRAL